MTILILLLTCLTLTYSQCTTPTTILDENICSGSGYCIQGSETDLFGCACLPGVSGSECQNDYDRVCVDRDVTATSSGFTTEISGYEDNGDIVLIVNAPIEDGEGDLDDEGEALVNFATFTTLRFANEDACDYPEGNVTVWDRVSFTGVGQDCTEDFIATTSFESLVQCTGLEGAYCLDANNMTVDGCLPENCENPPCKRCYPGSVLATRGYQRTSLNGALSRPSTAENCHYFGICLPWIQDVQAEVQVTFIPDFPRNFILTRVAFSCFEDIFDDDCVVDPENSWLIEIQAAVNYPWYLVEDGNNGALVDNDSGKRYPLKGLHNENCNVVGEQCIQTLHFAIPGCNSLENATSLNVSGLFYDCSADGCDDAKAELGAMLEAQAQVIIQSTQDNCGADFSIDATDTVTLDMNSYFSDYDDENSVFVAGDDTLGTAYFRITIESNLPVTQAILLEVTSTDQGVDTILLEGTSYFQDDSEGYVNGCPQEVEQPSICFHVEVSNVLVASSGSEDLITIDVSATVEISYEPIEEEKRTMKRSVSGLGTNFDLNQNIRVIPEESNYEENQIETGNSLALTTIISSLILSLL